MAAGTVGISLEKAQPAFRFRISLMGVNLQFSVSSPLYMLF
jgi:hypothetical protein